MKRLLCIALTALLLLAGCTGSVPAGSAGDATATPSVALERPSPMPTPTPTLQITPKPMHTPTPAPTVYIPDPVVYTGSGDDVIEVTPPEGIWVLRATGNASGRYFAIKGYNSLGEQTELFVNTTEPYSGTTVAPLADVAMLEITAHGDWTIELVSALEMQIVSGGESISGTGDSVFLVHNPGSTATISGNSDSRYFAVISYGTDSIDMMVNTTDEYSGTVMLNGTPVFIAVTAVGDWEVKLN